MNHFSKQLLGTLLLFSLLLPLTLKAEGPSSPAVKNPPISLELLAGDRALAYQVTINKKFQSAPKLGFFGVTNLQPEWQESRIDDYMLQGNLTYSLIEGIDLATGFLWNPVDGIRPSAGIMFSYGNPHLLAVANPRIDLHTETNFELLGLIEYKPKINDIFSLYSRLQGMFTHNFGYDDHARSYIMVRAGATYQDITFGLASNFDWYGPFKQYKHNFGLFAIVNLF